MMTKLQALRQNWLSLRKKADKKISECMKAEYKSKRAWEKYMQERNKQERNKKGAK